MRPTFAHHWTLLAVFACAALSVPAGAQRLFVGLEGSTPPAKSSDLSGFPNVAWTNHGAFDVSGAAATPEGTVYVCNGAFTTRLYRFPLGGAPQYLCNLGVDAHGLGYGNGTLYGFSNFSSPMGIYTLNPVNGQAALAVDLTASGFRFFALDFNEEDGLLYGYTEYGTPTGLYSIDPASGTMTFVTGPIPAVNSQGRALAVGDGIVYLAATRGDDEIPLYAFDLEAGVQWVPFTQPYPLEHATGGATWVPAPFSGANNPDQPVGIGPAIERITPNPARGTTRIEWRVPAAGPYRLELWSVAGRRVATIAEGTAEAGAQATTLSLGASELSAGVYYLRLEAGARSGARSILIVR